MRDQLIAEKTKEIQQELEVWAKSNNILKPDERLLFSLQVEEGSSIVPQTVADIYEMDAEEFFSVGRICSFGVSHRRATIICNTIRNDWYWEDEERIRRHKSMRDFFTVYGGVTDLLHIPNLGRSCIKEMVLIMRKSGFLLEGPKWKVD